jgi:outer membrane protein assembly factor BamB
LAACSGGPIRSGVLLVLLVGLLGLQFGMAPVSGSPTAWPMFRFDPAHTGATPDIVTPPLTLEWVRSANSSVTGSGVDCSPAIFEGTVYSCLGDNDVYAFDAATGALRWDYAISGDDVGSPAVSGGVVYVAADINLYALDASTGTLQWSYTTGYATIPSVSAPTVSRGVVYIGARDVYALDASSGTLKWNSTTEGIVGDSPAVSDGVVYVGSSLIENGQSSGKVYALDAITGGSKWSYTTGGWIYSSPTVSEGIVYVGSNDDKVYALDASTGALKWSYTTSGQVASSPAVSGGVVYVGSGDGELYALDALTGASKWSYKTGAAIASSPSVSGASIVYVGSIDDKLYALNAVTGALMWNYTMGPLGYVVNSSPTISGASVYVGVGSGGGVGGLYAFSEQGALFTSALSSSFSSISAITIQSASTSSQRTLEFSSQTMALTPSTVPTMLNQGTNETPIMFTYVAIVALVVAVMLLGVFMALKRMSGKRTVPAPPATKFCKSCGSQIAAVDLFCDRCGTSQA